ncbi:OmpA family protein [Catalinimonas alkaloidigena]|uniref:OmpA family protein n=1 Tax=Catalinimonas alkaloidigena TaxID=1075417 RepID=A0A1G9LPU4_9BACT|nr:OmpA family protein [Catalinimonas alkaloidigena]SDL63827.1 OmpA family protein [Catalinimonas alkaloidigena]
MQPSKDFFWPSYVDLMTALFVVMLSLFVLSFKLFKDREGELLVMAQQYQKLQEIERSLQGLEGEYFVYDEDNKRHELKVPVQFASWESTIDARYHEPLRQAGLRLKNLIKNIRNDENVNYLIIIEGMAARDRDDAALNRDPDFIQRTYDLSYQRALALRNLWRQQGITFEEGNLEVIIAGSGVFGTGRYTGAQEGQNKRFLIQIIPKIGELEN